MPIRDNPRRPDIERLQQGGRVERATDETGATTRTFVVVEREQLRDGGLVLILRGDA